MIFSKDIDLLPWETEIFKDLAFNSQIYISGSDAVTTNTTLTSASANFINAQIKPGHVIHLSKTDQSINGVYEIVSVDSATQLTISVLRLNDQSSLIEPPASVAISYKIISYEHQASECAESLLQYFGIKSQDTATILNPGTLKQASIFSILSSLYSRFASDPKDPNGYWRKASYYQQLFNTARVKVRIEIDLNQNGQPEKHLRGGSVTLQRK